MILSSHHKVFQQMIRKMLKRNERKILESNGRYKEEPSRNLELKNKVTKIKLKGWAQYQNGRGRGKNQ